MKPAEVQPSICAMERALAVVGDRWALMILRDAFLGVRRFDEFQRRSGMARNVLANRLSRLVDHGLLARAVYQDRPVRHEYRLMPKGQGLFPIVLSLASWSQQHFAETDAPEVSFRHRDCEHPMHPVLACSACGGGLDARSVELNLESEVGNEAALLAFSG